MRLLYVRSKENGCEKALCNADGNPCDKNCVGHIDSAVAVEISGGFRIGEFCGKGVYADCTAGNLNCVRKCNAAVAVNIAEKNGGIVVGLACNNVDALAVFNGKHIIG